MFWMVTERSWEIRIASSNAFPVRSYLIWDYYWEFLFPEVGLSTLPFMKRAEIYNQVTDQERIVREIVKLDEVQVM